MRVGELREGDLLGKISFLLLMHLLPFNLLLSFNAIKDVKN